MKEYLKVLLEAGAEVYEVGGMVRDAFLKRFTKDQDYLVQNLSIKQLANILKPFGKVALVGQSFGVVKFWPHKEDTICIDFSLPRKEFSTGIGHKDFDVSFDPKLPVQDDLSRRDFTINAMAKNIRNQELIDPFNGQRDLENNLLKQVFSKAFEEDPLRMLRAIQFTTRFNFKIEKNTFDSIKKNKELIKSVSNERIIEEIKKLFLAEKPSIGFDLMHETELLEIIFPELTGLKKIKQDKRPGEDVYDHTMRAFDAIRSDPAIDNRGNLNLMFAALFHDIGKATTTRYHEPSKRIVFFGHQIVSEKMARRILKRLKAETIGVDIKTVCKLIHFHMFETKAFYSDRAIRRFVQKVGKEDIFLLLDLRLGDNRGGKHPNSIKGVLNLKKRITTELAKKPPFGPKDLKVNGKDIMNLGVDEGPKVGYILNELVTLVVDNPELNTKEELLKLAKNIINNN